MQADYGLETLLDLDGVVIEQTHGFWVKFEVARTKVTQHRPHGIRYSLTLHDRYGQRVMGYDNAHGLKLPQKYKYAGQKIEYDHHHRHSSDKGVPYEFESAYQLLEDFFASVDEILGKARH
jgi:hypothetical protein